MYSYIHGIIKKIEPSNVVIDNNGIGYLIIVPNPYKYKLENRETIYTHHYVREDINNLYGFETEDAKKLFIKLIGVNGIGPKSALSILATDDINGVVLAIENGDAKFLTKFPGIGNKSAQQIILDLHGKLVETEQLVRFEKIEEAEEALLALGYSKKEVVKVLKDIDNELTVEEIIKLALKKILN
ncbi:Holliday junction branch migration protein RuvA [Haploplasma axanthum]|uniref:Holliday junction branch migration complex subunit RuvA n=1 Tax=Haploplasma axanthum TaxID=29552 RepID=A0A449BEA2_HAPAX|nr:Holliday junction branch migration protein RuvA [Haploplasma axanthum]VEU80756.1 Holliday junction DNA helicase [Haploplasma axanthum]